MPTNAERWQTHKVIRLLRKATEKEVIRLVIDIHRDLAIDTPVDTGWAAANWIISMGTFSTEPAGSRENVSKATSNAGLAGLLNWTLKDGTIYITNNVPYIIYLNEGHSDKAPPGYVDMIIQERTSAFDRKVIG